MGAQGTAIVDFGAWPGGSFAQVDVTGQGTILTTSSVEAWVRPQDATALHSVDEHVAETLKVTAGKIVGATGFTIFVEVQWGTTSGTFNLNWAWN